MVTLLDIPDSPEMRTNPEYSRPAAAILLDAYDRVKRRAYDEALAYAARLADMPMSVEQRQRARYVSALAAVGLERLDTATQGLLDALETAAEEEDVEAVATLASFTAQVQHELQRCEDAAEYLDISLDAYRSLPADQRRQRASEELVLLAKLAAHRFMSAAYTDAMATAEEARLLARSVPNCSRQLGEIEWTTALLYRWNGSVHAALEHALEAYRIYRSLDLPGVLARLRIVLADILLDLAVRYLADGDQEALHSTLAQARPHILEALAQTSIFDDGGGQGMALLAYARYQRLTTPGTSARDAIWAAEQIALQTKDWALLGSAYTAYGDELAAEGRIDEAREAYTRALSALEQTQAPALSKWPRSALMRLQEMGGA
jgi:tetratricopeptide (TPR) repeat protein